MLFHTHTHTERSQCRMAAAAGPMLLFNTEPSRAFAMWSGSNSSRSDVVSHRAIETSVFEPSTAKSLHNVD